MFTGRRPHFLQVFHPNVCSDRLKVPEKFVKHLEGKICGFVSLIGPSGNSWNVKLSMQNEELFLDDGWATFVKDNSIECGDSFVFRYDGELHFSVQIFDQTSCEKEVAFYSKHIDATLIGRKRERGRKPVPLNAAYLGSQPKTRSINSPAFLECETASIKEKVSIASRKAVAMARSSYGNDQWETHTRQRKPKVTTKNKPNISTFIEQRAAEYFVSQFPFFVRVMKASNVSSSGTLKIPVQFSMKHLPSCRTNVVLENLEGKSWTLSSVPTIRVQMMHTLCGGWTAFVRDNDIKMDDVCIFELVGDCEMRVRVIRLGLEGLDCEGIKSGISGFSDACAQITSKKDESMPRSPKGKNAKNGAQIFNGGSLLNQTEKRSLPHSSGRFVTPANSTDGTSAAEFFTSLFPNFIKVMKISNISGPCTMPIPSTFATAHFPSCRTEIILRNLKGECWTVNSYPSSVRCTAHTLCGGWMTFVRENGIKLGDTCVFELVGKEELQVHVFKNGQ